MVQGLANRVKHYPAAQIVAGSALFDADWYLATNPDVPRQWRSSALSHYLEHGARERRDPGPLFDTAYYLSQFPRLDTGRINPVCHYLIYGEAAGAWPNRFFDPLHVAAQLGTVCPGENILASYVALGPTTVAPSAAFDPRAYAEAHPSLAASGLNLLWHRLFHERPINPLDILLSSDYVCTAHNHLNILTVKDGLVHFHVTGHDPHLILMRADERRIEPGHYSLKFRFAGAKDTLESAKAYLDTGTGFSEANSARLTFREKRKGWFETDLALDEPLTRLRLDPMEGKGGGNLHIGIGKVFLAPVSRSTCYCKFLRGLSRIVSGLRPEEKAQRLPPAQPISRAIWNRIIGADVPRTALPPPARDPVVRAQRGVVLQAGEPWIAVVIHAFYPELLDDILDRVARLPVQAKLYVTAPEGAVPGVTASLERHALPFMLLETDNRGRDIAPFLSALDYVRQDGAQLLLKLHTKRSPHLENGDQWRNQLLDSLLDPATAARAMEALRADPALGVLAPDGHVLSVAAFLGANAGQVSRLSKKLEIAQETIEASVFVAGSMFYARPRIFYPLIEAAICTSDFEVERGQLDGTLAHGIERLLGAFTAKQGMRLSSIGDLDKQSSPLGRGAYPFV